MRNTVNPHAAGCQVHSSGSSVREASNIITELSQDVRRAIERAGLKETYVAAFTGTDRSSFSKMLNSQKPWPPRVIYALPVEVREWLQILQGRRLGLIVERPTATPESFVQSLLAVLRATTEAR